MKSLRKFTVAHPQNQNHEAETCQTCSFHPADVRKQMLRYQIGVLANRWENVLPPLQRGYGEETQENVEIEIDDGSETESLSSSANLSDIFDDDLLSPALTRRRTRNGSISSRSSVSDVESPSPPKTKTKVQKDIKLPELTSESTDSAPPAHAPPSRSRGPAGRSGSAPA